MPEPFPPPPDMFMPDPPAPDPFPPDPFAADPFAPAEALVCMKPLQLVWLGFGLRCDRSLLVPLLVCLCVGAVSLLARCGLEVGCMLFMSIL